MTGTVISLFYDSYGFVRDDGGQTHFFHMSSLIDCSFDQLSEGDVVEFRIGIGSNGKEQALDVRKMGSVSPEPVPAALAKQPVLIVSLSTFPRSQKLEACRFCCLQKGQEDSGEYFCQQEPFPIHLRQEFSEGGEIIMLSTEETQKEMTVECGGEMFTASPLSFFKDRVLAIPGLNNTRFLPVTVEQDAPEGAIREVVEHLRSLRADGLSPEVYLGTNGGLRGIQLILEAILSLASAEGIRVDPGHVWSMRQLGSGEWELFNSAAEFRVFDFVSGINEFLQYGRIDSLDRFLRSNPELKDESAYRLMGCLGEIAEGIQFCSTRSFDRGLDRLAAYYRETPSIGSPYIEMFRETIQNDFGQLLSSERSITDKLEWCCRKGFYLQAFTIVESEVPRELWRREIFAHDEASAAVVEMPGWDGDPSVQVFNVCLTKTVKLLEEKPWLMNQSRLFINNVGPDRVTLIAEFPGSAIKSLLKLHNRVKEVRNGLVHGDEKGDRSTEDYKAVIWEYLRELEKTLGIWEKQGGSRPLMNVYIQ